ncbi:glycosyltransferase family 2 protein [Sulfurovum sp.]|uniref:glycosyltransferase family 2 protein n=1 Tax=Sulfurovum sp. TaxID=1969726 RepID=UPI00286809D8|nr:glycosyltransferase family 2 protein [Sulfurovum sp.]
MDNVLISIAIATYNGEKYLEEQLDSIYAQTYKNIEVVVADDCSTDKTVEILEQYSKSHGLKYFVNKQNLGFVKNFEKAITLCQGEYVALADQDDIWKKNKIQILYHHVGEALLIHSDASLIDAEGEIINTSYAQSSHKVFRKDIIGYFFNNDATGCTMMFSKKLLSSIIPIPSNSISHDWWIAIQAKKREKIIYVPEPLIRYRQHQNNQIGAINTAKISSHTVRVSAHQKKLLFLQTLRQAMDSSTNETEALDDLIYYYQTYFDKNIRIVAFYTHIKYFKYFHDDKKISYRLFGLLLSLFGEKIQRKLWGLVNK